MNASPLPAPAFNTPTFPLFTPPQPFHIPPSTAPPPKKTNHSLPSTLGKCSQFPKNMHTFPDKTNPKTKNHRKVCTISTEHAHFPGGLNRSVYFILQIYFSHLNIIFVFAPLALIVNWSPLLISSPDSFLWRQILSLLSYTKV